jgi:microcystin-dependent protein
MDPYLGEIRLFSFNFAPANWMVCNGQLLQVQQNQALYALLGVYYGGSAGVNFNLPKLNGVALMGTGRSPVAPNTVYTIGQRGGTETIALTTAQVPTHNHTIKVNTTYDSSVPGTNFFGNPNVKTNGAVIATNFGTANVYAAYTQPADMTTLHPASITNGGASAPHENRMPFLALTYCICTLGNFPPRD